VPGVLWALLRVIDGERVVSDEKSAAWAP
jgi:hypothetical protein